MANHETGYQDLDEAVADIVARAAERIEEKEDEHEPAGWRGGSPFWHWDKIDRDHWNGLYDALLLEDREAPSLKEAADILNHLGMMMVNVYETEERESGGPE